MKKDFPLIYKDEKGKKIRLRRDKFRRYHDEQGRTYTKCHVWKYFTFIKHEYHQVQYVTTPNGFRVRA